MAKYEYWQKKENKEQIRNWIINGRSRSDICSYMQINKSTFYNWINEHEDFKKLIKESEEIRKEVICDEMEEKLEKKALDFAGDFKSITYYLERMRPEKWSKKKEPVFNKKEIPVFIDNIPPTPTNTESIKEEK